MAAALPLVTFQPFKSDMAALSTSPVVKAYSRPTIVNFVTSSRTTRPTSATSWGTGRRGEYIFPRFTGSSILPQPLLNTQNKHPVLCSIGPAGSTDRSVGIYKKLKAHIKIWCDKQCILVGAAVYTFVGGFECAMFSLAWRYFIDRFVDKIDVSNIEQIKPYLGIYYPLLFSFIGSPFLTARSFAVLMGSIDGISYVMKRLRGKEDVLTSMVTAFGTAVIYSLVSGMRSPVMIAIGFINALVCGLIFKLTGRGTATSRT